MAYVDCSFAYGVLDEGPAPVVVNAPEGSRIKLRFRQDDITRAFVRHANGDFTAWSLDWVDRKARTMKLMYPMAANMRSGSSWQPIEKAPKDGTRILVFEGFEPTIESAWYNEGEFFPCSNRSRFWKQPTHFQPLPKDP